MTPRPTSFFSNDTAPTAIYTLSLHDALPIYPSPADDKLIIHFDTSVPNAKFRSAGFDLEIEDGGGPGIDLVDRKSTRLNSSHSQISYAVFCLKKKKKKKHSTETPGDASTLCS